MSTKSSSSSSSSSQSRRERRAAERRDRFDTARGARRERVGGPTGASSSLLSTRNLTLGALFLGAVLIAVVALNQLGGRGAGESFTNPELEYPAAIRDGTALGSPTAPVVLEVWGDFQCPACAQHSLEIEPSLVNQFVLSNQLRIVHHDIDILGGNGDESRLPAIGAACANEQDRYWDFAHWIFANQDGENRGGFKRDRVVAIAGAAGLDTAAFSACLDSPAAADAFAQQQAKGQELGIRQTPTMFLNGTKSAGVRSPSDWAALIQAELAKATASPAASPTEPSGPAGSTTP